VEGKTDTEDDIICRYTSSCERQHAKAR